jgi:hypothetical protein
VFSLPRVGSIYSTEAVFEALFTRVRGIGQLVEKLDAGFIWSPKSGFRASKQAFLKPNRGPEVGNGEFFNSLRISANFAFWGFSEVRISPVQHP